MPDRGLHSRAVFRTIGMGTVGVLVLACGGGWPTQLEQTCFLDRPACVAIVQEGIEDPSTLPEGETRESVIELARSSCVEGQEAPFCFVYAKTLDWSVGSERATALETMQVACDADYEDGCFQMARIHEEPGDGQDLATARGGL